jgi:hypothetical protein
MQAACTMFGIRFIEGIPKDVLPENYENDAAYQHAVRKLRGNQFFQEINDEPGTLEVLEAPKPKRGRPAKPVVAEEATYIEDAAE